MKFENEENFKILTDIYASFEKNGISSKLTHLDLRDKFNIKARIEDRFEIVFGSYESSDAKASLLSEVLAGDLWTDASGIIDVSDTREAVVRLTGTVAN